MKTTFHTRLLNTSFGDPGVVVNVEGERRSFLFDLGECNTLGARQLLRVSDVFVSHTHLDHFVGFDRLLRVALGRSRTIRLYGPTGFAEQVNHRLQSYSWNLLKADEAALTLVVHELDDDGWGIRATFAGRHKFVPSDVKLVEFGSTLLAETRFQVRAAVLDHHLPCLAFHLSEPVHIGVDKVWLEKMGLAPGPWLSALKRAVRASVDPQTPLTFDHPDHSSRRWTVGELSRCLNVGQGQHLGYVTDIAFSRSNVELLHRLMSPVDHLYIEAAFLDTDRELAAKTKHLTAAQAGTLARWLGAKRMTAFHFSPRYEGRGEALEQEARAAFGGILPEPPLL